MEEHNVELGHVQVVRRQELVEERKLVEELHKLVPEEQRKLVLEAVHKQELLVVRKREQLELRTALIKNPIS